MNSETSGSGTSRRGFLLKGGVTLAALGLAAAPVLIGGENEKGPPKPPPDEPTPPSGELGSYGDYLKSEPQKPAGEAESAAREWAPTEDNIQGPFYRAQAPFRAKITPPLAEGTVLLVRGTVYGHDSRKPLAGARLDVWQANHAGRYDNDDPDAPPKPDVFKYRARLITDEQGRYEYETIHPGRYKIGEETWRPAHIHYLVRHPGYRALITQLYFKGDPHNKGDAFIKPSLIVELTEVRAAKASYETATFDIVLAKA